MVKLVSSDIHTNSTYLPCSLPGLFIFSTNTFSIDKKQGFILFPFPILLKIGFKFLQLHKVTFIIIWDIKVIFRQAAVD